MCVYKRFDTAIVSLEVRTTSLQWLCLRVTAVERAHGEGYVCVMQM